MTDWQAWHAGYEDPSSSLSRRLLIVRRRVEEALGGARPVRRVLSLCAGDGRDLIPALAALPVDRRPEAVLVELDESLASVARQHAADAGVTASVVVGDAGRLRTWGHAIPVDLLMQCGIFGNVDDADVQRMITASRAVLTTGGTVIWTRGYAQGQDMRGAIRNRFHEAGFEEVAFDSEPAGFGVGVARLLQPTTPATSVPEGLFAFAR
ncbi:MAG: hypothetical protein QOJ48_1229 [Frankiales bacterium]|jgi:hypothetical protein|nr:hypothetical protein [Frankiales bacterium]